MANRPKSPMPISERAKQFLPFAAVKGLNEALAIKEKIPVAKKEITEEMAMILNEKLHDIKIASKITVTYFDTDAYFMYTGIVTRVDSIFHELHFEEFTVKMDDILELEMDKF